MRRLTCLLALGITAIAALAQAPAPANPVTTAARQIAQRRGNDLVAAAQEMPAGKYGFKPTPAQLSYGMLMAHIANSNQFLCSALGGAERGAARASDSDSPDVLVKKLQESFAACTEALAKLGDRQLGEEVMLFRGRQDTKAAALLELTSDWADHYAAAAMYLRLNGLLPPTAKPKP